MTHPIAQLVNRCPFDNISVAIIPICPSVFLYMRLMAAPARETSGSSVIQSDELSRDTFRIRFLPRKLARLLKISSLSFETPRNDDDPLPEVCSSE